MQKNIILLYRTKSTQFLTKEQKFIGGYQHTLMESPSDFILNKSVFLCDCVQVVWRSYLGVPRPFTLLNWVISFRFLAESGNAWTYAYSSAKATSVTSRSVACAVSSLSTKVNDVLVGASSSQF